MRLGKDKVSKFAFVSYSRPLGRVLPGMLYQCELFAMASQSIRVWFFWDAVLNFQGALNKGKAAVNTTVI